MIWNTIAHPKMMGAVSGGAGDRSSSPIKFADPHKLSFYDIIISMTGTKDDKRPVLVKGDFETIKKMILNNEAVCGATFVSLNDARIANLGKEELGVFSYNYTLDAIELRTNRISDPLYLLNDNTISMTQSNGEDSGPNKK